ncbi:hypothetical protein B0H14DRAFT_3862719 [Mycena olivaceomarginata]|nr:hypothetical protein B0H14DRAFT_3862719 [Mycena olivaceomarginata]
MPATCSICLEPFTSPVSLPCGHIFCRDCIRRTVASSKPCIIQNCPACRTRYSIVPIDPGSVPPHLRPHILPPIRPVFFDDPAPTEASAASSSSISAPSPCPITQADDLRRAVAQMNAVEAHTASWRRRAEIHAAANQKLFAVARAAKDCALRMRQERDTERSRYVLLKRKLSELMPELDLESESPFTKRRCEEQKAVVRRAGLPAYLMQGKTPEQYYDNAADMECSHFGPPLKRRRDSPKRENDPTRTPDTAIAVPDAPPSRPPALVSGSAAA